MPRRKCISFVSLVKLSALPRAESWMDNDEQKRTQLLPLWRLLSGARSNTNETQQVNLKLQCEMGHKGKVCGDRRRFPSLGRLAGGSNGFQEDLRGSRCGGE